MALHHDAALPDGESGVGFPHDEDSTKRHNHNDTLSSPATTPLTTSFDTAPFLSFAEQSFTPLSNFDDSFDLHFSEKFGTGRGSVGRGAEEAGGGRPTATMGQSTVLERAPVGTEARGSSAFESRQQRTTISPAPKRASTAMGLGICIDRQQIHDHGDSETISPYHFQSPNLDRVASNDSGPNNSVSAPAPVKGPQYEPPVSDRPSVPRRTTDTASPSSNDALHGHGLGLNAHDTLSSSPLSSSDFPHPLRTGSVQPETRISQPRPQPIVRTPSEYGSLPLKHPTPELNSRSGAYVGNIAQLEATAVKLSMTSSIEDAIRDLHLELKRTESRRSSLLAASLRANSTDDYSQPGVGQLKRHLSTSSSIVSTNIAARHGGYSPAGYVKSPSHSLTGRLRSGSKNSSGRPEIDLDTVLSRHGPGKASVRSVRSTKLSLAEISEMEPVALTQDVLDKADKQPAMKNDNDSLPVELRDANIPATNMFHKMMGNDDFMDNPVPDHGLPDPNSHAHPQDEPRRPGSAGSTNTFQQCQDAFGDFDGVHWVPEHNDDPYAPPEEPVLPPPRMPQPKMVRPQSYIDPESGQQMLYYPARVPAMLNLPPKLSNKPRAAERNKRQSKVLSVMMDNRQSRVLDRNSSLPDAKRDSWLPDPLVGHRESFAALSSDQLAVGDIRTVPHEEPEAQPEVQPEPLPLPEPDFEGLRRPQRISRMDPDKRKSRMSQNLPPQLRASAYFDLPSARGPEIEVKDGSAMATLDSILDASAHAPVGAFTDHNYAGKLGSEVYGKEKKRASMAPSAILRTSLEEKGHKKKPSFNWLSKRQSYASLSQDRRDSFSDDDDGLGPVNADTRAGEREALTSSDDGSHVIRVDADAPEEEEEEELPEDDYCGPPTTLLAELQLRKQQQKQRTQMNFPNGMHATLLEMDAVAETQRKTRNAKRVNLAWEDVNAHMAQDDEDDEDVPLAIIAARNQGAQNVMDLNRPLGLMEKREMEDNEPLSHRRARLTGQDPRSLMIHKRPSMLDIAHSANGSQPPLSPGDIPEPEEEEVEGETLADRKRRLAAKDEAENPLPKPRPVSSVFSAELLSQFGDLDEKKEKENTPPKAPQEETLGQRRRRLQAEREARDREMAFNNVANTQAPPGIQRRMNMADVLAAHPIREGDIRAEEQRQHIQRENFLAREREAKLAAMRSQMPTSLTGPSVARSGGYQSGQFNDGTGGQGPQAAYSSPALHTQVYGPGNHQHRASTVFSTYAVPQQYGSTTNLGVLNNVGYNGMNTLPPYGGPMSMYGGGMMQPGMQMPMNGGSMDRVEQWRQGVYP